MKNNFTRNFHAIQLKSGLLFVSLCILLCVNANTYIVTNTLNTGAGSLRQAITDANTNPGYDVIQFNIGTSGNLFESSGADRWAVIEIATSLPTITGAVLIDGSTQPNTNLGSYTGKTVGVDNLVQPNINYPDVYIVPSAAFTFPANSSNITGSGINVNATGVVIRGIAISGFGNTNTNGSTASGHAEISFLRSVTVRDTDFEIYNCFLSCDPRGTYPAIVRRRSKGNGMLVCGNNFTGIIRNNFIAYCGTYGLHFNGLTDNLSVGPSNTLLSNDGWLIYENILFDITRNTGVTSSRVSDGITTSKGKRMRIYKNYIENVEQTGIDLGWNADSIYVENNTVTGFVKTTCDAAPQSAIRISLCTERDTLVKNKIYNNIGVEFLGGIWIDRLSTTQTGMVTKANSSNYIFGNEIYGNSSSGIVISTNGAGASTIDNKISQNSIHDNLGLGIDLNYNGTTGPPLVNVNDNNDVDAGVNNLQNFPLIDSAKINGSNIITIWGKVAAGATMEFYGSDGGVNNFGGRSRDYGEGEYYIGTGIEGSGSDAVSGTNPASVSVDGNLANIGTLNMFRFSFAYSGPSINVNQLTATATVSNNTSEFGPAAFSVPVLGCSLLDISALYADGKTNLYWSAIVDDKFSYFVIEKSSDGSRFIQLGTVLPESARSAFELKFDFTDNNPYDGNNYYRLKMIDKDGRITYSRVIKINTGIKTQIKLSPNPFIDEINLSVTMSTADKVVVKLTDMSGRTVLTRQFNGKKGINAFVVEGVGNLQKGYYLIEVSYEDQHVSEKMIRN